MNITLLPLAGLLPAILFAPLHAQGLGDPVLTTPGTATWSTEVTATGSRMVFTITGNTILDWGQFNLASGNELVFDFVGGESVANMLGGSAMHTIAGTVTSNGNVGFFSPGAPIQVTGSVTAKNVTIATMSVDPVAFNAGGELSMTAVTDSTLSVSGSVTATTGSVLLAGHTVRVRTSGRIEAAEAVRLARDSGVRLHIDHLHSTGGTFHMEEALTMFRAANDSGCLAMANRRRETECSVLMGVASVKRLAAEQLKVPTDGVVVDAHREAAVHRDARRPQRG